MSSKYKEVTNAWSALLSWMKSRFDLDADKAHEDEVKEAICRGVEFRGTNLWILIFATFVASLGLNINSTAVIIGAMLISPLMGPIMGIGLSVGINDMELAKRSIRNFGFMVLVGILTSTVYFMVSPLSQAQSELLARTTPTTYDVLIAFFGGLAGIVAQSRKDRTSTVIPGVAIATALMPPLCTVGFGIATMQFNYFIGALYLFFINTVFIAIATFLVVRFMKYSKKEFLDPVKERRMRQYMLVLVVCTLIPSFILGVRIVKRSIFETMADKYVTTVFNFPNTQVIDYTRVMNPRGVNTIKMILVGDPIPRATIDNLRSQLESYNLTNTELIVHQQSGGGEVTTVDYKTLNTGYMELIEQKNQQIKELEKRVGSVSVDTLPIREIARESGVLFPAFEGISVLRSVAYTPEGAPSDTSVICLIATKKGAEPLDALQQQRLVEWLQARTSTEDVKLFQH